MAEYGCVSGAQAAAPQSAEVSRGGRCTASAPCCDHQRLRGVSSSPFPGRLGAAGAHAAQTAAGRCLAMPCDLMCSVVLYRKRDVMNTT